MADAGIPETVVLNVTGEDAYEIQPDASFAENYGWDEDSGGGSEASASPPGGSGGTRRQPSTPAPGHEKTPQQPPRRERYACA